MAKMERSALIHAPTEQIFSYVADPANLPEVWPSMVEVKDIQSLPNGGHRFRWVYKMAGMRFDGTSDDLEYVANQRIVAKAKGGIEGLATWTFQPEAGGTRVSFSGEYTVPVPLLGRLAEAIIVKLNEHEAEVLLDNLKSRVEA